MNPTPEEMDEPIDRVLGRALWQQCRSAEAPADETLGFLDLAAFAEGGLDPDEHDRIAAWLVADPVAAADVAAARALAGGGSAARPRSIASSPGPARCVPPPRRSAASSTSFFRARRRIPLHGLTQWGSLAAAIGLAAWLGFTMGSGASFALSQPKLGGDDGTTIELFDPATGFLHDLPAGIQT